MGEYNLRIKTCQKCHTVNLAEEVKCTGCNNNIINSKVEVRAEVKQYNSKIKIYVLLGSTLVFVLFLVLVNSSSNKKINESIISGLPIAFDQILADNDLEGEVRVESLGKSKYIDKQMSHYRVNIEIKNLTKATSTNMLSTKLTPENIYDIVSTLEEYKDNKHYIQFLNDIQFNNFFFSLYIEIDGSIYDREYGNKDNLKKDRVLFYNKNGINAVESRVDKRKASIVNYLKSNVSDNLEDVSITDIKVNENLGTDSSEDYIALVYLSFDRKNTTKNAKDMLKVYSSDIAANSQSIDDISEITVFWKVPYLNDNDNVAKFNYFRTKEGFYSKDEWYAPLFN